MTATARFGLGNGAGLRLESSFLDDQAAMAHTRSLATMLTALWGGMIAATDRADERAHSCLLTGVDTGTGELGLRLAIAFAESGRATTLVDVAAAHGSLRFFAAAKAISGGSHGYEPAPSDETLTTGNPALPTDVPGLTYVPAGLQSNDVDLRRDDAVATLLDHLRTVANGVAIVVAPPLRLAPDALPLARHVDGVLLAVRPGRTERPEAIRARNGIVSSGGRVLGVVLSNESYPGIRSAFRLGGLLR